MAEPKSLSGHPLAGDCIVKMVFLDAAGLSNPAQEPVIVIAGIIIDADKEWKSLATYLSDMADDLAPPEHREGFAFHATELFSGGKRFPREKYPREWRWHVLDALADIPRLFGLPIVWARVPRVDVEPGGPHAVRPDWEVQMPPVVHGQVLAFNVVAVHCERWMNENAEPNELAQMIMENDNDSRKAIHAVQRVLTDPRHNTKLGDGNEKFRLSRIIYPIHFEEKTDSSALQVADICAFVLKRWCMKTPEISRFYDRLEPCLLATVRDDGSE
jgi:hypothetical protein